ncbi:MAG: hypothetical protein NVS2B4_09290 [Ramlibacter sp.]
MPGKTALIERAMGAELGHHLGYSGGAAKPDETANQRNGTMGKTALTGEGPLRLGIPRDRDGSFNPILIPKHERRFTGFDDKVIAMYARGVTMREIQGFPCWRAMGLTPDAIESINSQLRKIIKSRGHFPSDDAASKLLWLALRNITADWGHPAHHWKEAMTHRGVRSSQATPAALDKSAERLKHKNSDSPVPAVTAVIPIPALSPAVQ